jgi:predicted RNA methylase
VKLVVDLGSGGGMDVFLASKMAGPEGRAIGIDITPAMTERAQTNAKAGGYGLCKRLKSATRDRRPSEKFLSTHGRATDLKLDRLHTMQT